MASVVGGGKDELAGQGEAGRVPHHPIAKGELTRHQAHRVLGGAGGNAHHHVGAEHILQQRQAGLSRKTIQRLAGHFMLVKLNFISFVSILIAFQTTFLGLKTALKTVNCPPLRSLLSPSWKI